MVHICSPLKFLYAFPNTQKKNEAFDMFIIKLSFAFFYNTYKVAESLKQRYFEVMQNY